MFCFLVFQMVLSSDSTLSSKTDQETGLKFHFPAQKFQTGIFKAQFLDKKAEQGLKI